MADTDLTYAALIAALADNTTGNITPQVLRNMVLSLVPNYIEIYDSTPTFTSIAVAGTYVKVAGTFTVGTGGSRTCTMASFNKIQHSDTVRRLYDVKASLNLSCAVAATKNISVAFALNGTVITSTAVSVDTSATSGLKSTVSLSAQIPMTSSTDTIDIWVTNNTDTTTVTVTNAVITAMGHVY